MRWVFKPFINPSVVVLLLRLFTGVSFFLHGSQKVFGWFGGKGLEATIDAFGKSGIPPFLVYMASLTELLGGIFLILGLLTRVATLGLAITMLFAIFRIHLSNGFFNPTGFEYPLALFTISVCLMLYGAGYYSLDELVARRYRRTHVSEDGGLRTEYKAHYRL